MALASSSLRTPTVFATLYSVQGGDAQIISKDFGGKEAYTQSMMSMRMSAGMSRSRDVTSQPSRLQTLPTEPVPEKSSNIRIYTITGAFSSSSCCCPCFLLPFACFSSSELSSWMLSIPISCFNRASADVCFSDRLCRSTCCRVSTAPQTSHVIFSAPLSLCLCQDLLLISRARSWFADVQLTCSCFTCSEFADFHSATVRPATLLLTHSLFSM